MPFSRNILRPERAHDLWHTPRGPRPRWAPCLGAGAIDFERADHEHVIVLGEAYVQAGLEREAGGVDEVGVSIAGGMRTMGCGFGRFASPASPLGRAYGGATPTQWEAEPASPTPRLPRPRRPPAAAPAAGRRLAWAGEPGAAFQVQLLLDLVPAGVRDLVSQLSQLREVAPEGPFGHASALGKLEGVEPGSATTARGC